jgi:type IV conjugative transfer system protein TraE
MLFKNLQEKWARVAASYALCRTVVFLLLLFIAFLLVLYTQNVEREKIILLPPAVYKKVFISDSDASPEYIKEMADYVTYLATNYTPQTVKARLNEFLAYIDPSVYPKVKEQVEKVAQDVKAYGRTQAFFPKEFEIDKKHKKVIIKGRLLQSYMGKMVTDKPQTYVLEYTIRNGEFLVTSFYPLEKKKKGEKK